MRREKIPKSVKNQQMIQQNRIKKQQKVMMALLGERPQLPPLPSHIQIPADQVNDAVTMLCEIFCGDVAELPLSDSEKELFREQVKQDVTACIMPNIIPSNSTQ